MEITITDSQDIESIEAHKQYPCYICRQLVNWAKLKSGGYAAFDRNIMDDDTSLIFSAHYACSTTENDTYRETPVITQ